MAQPKKSQHAHGDKLFAGASAEARKLHQQFKETKRKQDRAAYMSGRPPPDAGQF